MFYNIKKNHEGKEYRVLHQQNFMTWKQVRIIMALDFIPIQMDNSTVILCKFQIQDLAADLLMRYFSWPLSPTDQPDCKACHLLSHALTLCNSPKAYESESGALLCKIVFIK